MRRDGRAVSEVIGFILLFGLVIAGASIIQTYGVPAQNERVEFDHNLRVQDDVVRLADDVETAGLTGASISATVEAGTDYPNRLFFFNPAPPSGTLATGDALNITIANASATGDAFDYWNGTMKTFDTRAVTYTSNYNVYRQAPTTVAEYGVVYNDNPNGHVTVLKRGSLVRGDRISLVTVDGTFNRGSSQSISVDAVPLSAPSQTVTLTSTRNITITIETSLSAAEWGEILADELAINGGNVLDVHGAGSAVTIVLAPNVSYEFRLARVGLESGYDESTASVPTYLTVVGDTNRTVPETTTHVVTFEVRDAFNNPVSGEPVGIRTDIGRIVGTNNSTTAANGRVSFTYEAPIVDGTSTQATRLTATVGGVPSGTVVASAPDASDVVLTVANSDSSGVSTVGSGEGGESAWSTNDTTETFSQANGKWTNISQIDTITLSNARTVTKEVCNSGGQQCAFVDRLAIDFLLYNEEASYTVSVRLQDYDNDDDLGDGLGSNSQDRKNLRYVKLYQDGDKIFDKTISETDAEAFLFNDGSLALLDTSRYTPGGTGDADDLAAVKLVAAEWLTGTMEGRVDVTID